VAAPDLAIEYYGLASNARLSDLIRCVRADEQHHAVANARFADVRKTAQHIEEQFESYTP
jgi:ubiquinol oxidase